MNEQTTPTRTEALVAKILDKYRVVINKGAKDGVKVGDRYLVYAVGEELYDPATQESLGCIEIVRGTGKVMHIQERMATLRTDRIERSAERARRIIKKVSPFFRALGTDEEIHEELGGTEEVPFDDPAVGDRARPI